MYREHVSRLLCRDRRHIRDTNAELGQRCRRCVCLSTVDAVVRGRAYLQYVPAGHDKAAQSKGGLRASTPRAADHRRKQRLLPADARRSTDANVA